MQPKKTPTDARCRTRNNPSSWNQRFLIAFIALIATFIALYLGLYQWEVFDSVWDPLFKDGTAKVLTSPLSHEFTRWMRIPDAILGVFAYLADVVFALAGSNNRWQDRPWLVILFGISVIPVGIVSIILVVLQGVVVKFWCFLCLVSASISLILIFLAYNEVISSLVYLHEIKKKSDWKTVWWAFWGYPSLGAFEAAEATLKRRSQKCGQDSVK
jgi:uncharacterized membrane protein